tara:strand:- start:180 stop:554 length:375 start_codon:yes stop_codon:yes gene_type:complete
MLAAILFGIFAGFFLRGVYNKYTVSKIELVLFKEIELYCLQLLIMTHEDFVYLKEKKAMMMHKMGVDENEVKIVKNVDEANIIKWQHVSINKFLLAIPPRFKKYVEYRDWRGAMIYLHKFIKKA